MQHQKKERTLKKLFSSGLWVFLTGFSWELVEEMLESVIAETLTNIIAEYIVKALLTFTVISTTILIKNLIKKILRPIIKTLTYREGNDKVSKFKEFFQWIFANKKSLLGIVGSSVATLSGTGIIDIAGLPALLISGFNITPILYYGILLVLSILGISGKGFETIKGFFDRIKLETAEKEQKAIEKEAKKELVKEQKLANQTQAQQEKAKAKKEAEEKAKAEKEKADAEYRAKVEKAKLEIKAQEQAKKNENA